MQELNEELQSAKDSAKAMKGRESVLKEVEEALNQELQRSHRTQRRLQTERDEREQEVKELRQQVKRLSNALQVGKQRYMDVCNKLMYSTTAPSSLC